MGELMTMTLMRQSTQPQLFDLSDLAVIDVTGEQAPSFLQGQLTCDVLKIEGGQAQQGALCNLKGRILALVDVLRARDGYQLVLPKSLVEATINTLNKVAMLSRVILKHATGVRVFGLYFQADGPPAISSELASCYCMSESERLVIVAANRVDELMSQFASEHQCHMAEAWHKHQLSQKRVMIYPETRGQFLPHRLDLHKTSTISFEKGCYKGQEIIARMQYKSKQKHHLALFTIANTLKALPGMPIYRLPGQQEIGEVIDVCPFSDNAQLVAASILNNYPDKVYFGTSNALTLLSVSDHTYVV